MAFFKNLSFLFLIFSILFVHIHARESNSFSKFSRNSNDPTAEDHKNPSFSTETPKKTVKEQDPRFVRESGNGYGLYGHETADRHVSNNYNGESFKGKPYETRDSYNYGYNNGKTGNNYHNRNYERNNGFGDSVVTGKVYETDDVASRNYNDVERQGMSDTRFMENGKYFYDVNDEQNNYNYRPDRYFSYYKDGSSRKNEHYVNNNVRDSYEFDKYPEEFEDVEDNRFAP